MSKYEKSLETFKQHTELRLADIFLERQLLIVSDPELQEEIDGYITDKSHKYMEKYSRMDKKDLLLEGVIRMVQGFAEASNEDDRLGERK